MSDPGFAQVPGADTYVTSAWLGATFLLQWDNQPVVKSF